MSKTRPGPLGALRRLPFTAKLGLGFMLFIALVGICEQGNLLQVGAHAFIQQFPFFIRCFSKLFDRV